MKTTPRLVWAVSLSILAVPLATQAQSATLLTTITNPTPAASDYFGYAVAAVGSDRVLIGAPYDNTGATDAGAAYLFRTNGTLLATIANPAPAVQDYFGRAVAAVGSDYLLIGADGDDRGGADAGTAYLFRTNGTLLTTITNPFPPIAGADSFGCAVAAFGADRVLVGAASDSLGASYAGAAYLLGTNGLRLATFTNPTPAMSDVFGSAVAAVGPDRVLIGAYGDDRGGLDSGVAYLFTTNSVLVTTFTNPTPAVADYFGFALAAVGTDRVLIGAYLDNTGAGDTGAAYLFRTNGVLLLTITNPAPAANDWFGYSVAALGTDRLLIGALKDDAGATDAGAAYLFDTNGLLLATITNPAPAISDWFGCAVAAADAGWFIVGAYQDDAGTGEAGSAYLYALPSEAPPELRVAATATNTVRVSWPSPSAGWKLQQNSNDVSSLNWSNVTDGIADDGTNKTLIVNPPTGNRFYRLQR